MDTDLFHERIDAQLERGTRHHHENIHRAYMEFRDIAQLRVTEPIEQDFDWWMVRARIMALDYDRTKPVTMWARRN